MGQQDVGYLYRRNDLMELLSKVFIRSPHFRRSFLQPVASFLFSLTDHPTDRRVNRVNGGLRFLLGFTMACAIMSAYTTSSDEYTQWTYLTVIYPPPCLNALCVPTFFVRLWGLVIQHKRKCALRPAPCALRFSKNCEERGLVWSRKPGLVK